MFVVYRAFGYNTSNFHMSLLTLTRSKNLLHVMLYSFFYVYCHNHFDTLLIVVVVVFIVIVVYDENNDCKSTTRPSSHRR